MMNKIFEELEARKRDMVKRFCDGTPFNRADTTFCQNHGLIFVNGEQWALTEYGRSYLPAGPDSDHSQCPDDDSYWPPGRAEMFEHVRAQRELNVRVLSALNLDPPILNAPPAEDRGCLDVQVGGDHYKKMGHHQPWEVLATWMTPDELRGYMKGTVIAYLARERDKGGDIDIEKVQHTIQLWQQVRKDNQND